MLWKVLQKDSTFGDLPRKIGANPFPLARAVGKGEFCSKKALKKEKSGKDIDIDAVNPASDMGANREGADKERMAAYRGRPVNHASISGCPDRAGGSIAVR